MEGPGYRVSVIGSGQGRSTMVRTAFRAECTRLTDVLAGLDEADLDRPTGCSQWAVRDLLAHVRTGAGRLVGMLAETPPPVAEVDAARYFGAAKFTVGVDADRVASARREAGALPGGPALAVEFERTWRAAYDAVQAEEPGRVVRTRHGEAMTVDEFLLTRMVEVAVHGLDLAAALGRPVWLTGPAAEVVAGLLVGGAGEAVPATFGWDRRTLIAMATGRAPLTGAERTALESQGFRWLSFS